MQPVNPATPLSTTQERRLVDYLEEQFLELTRGYKKRLIPRDLFPSPLHLSESGRAGRTPQANSQHSQNILKLHTTSST